MAEERRAPHSLRDQTADQIRNEQRSGASGPGDPNRSEGPEANATMRQVWSQPGGEAHNLRNAMVGAGFVPDVLDRSVIDDVVTVSNQTAFEISRLVAKLEGIPGGISTGANVAAALEVASRPEFRGKRIVTVAPSFAERYISSALFEGL